MMEILSTILICISILITSVNTSKLEKRIEKLEGKYEVID